MPAMNCLRAIALGWAAVIIASPALAQSNSSLHLQNATMSAAAAPAAQEPNPDRGFVQSARRWAEKHQILERLSGDVDGWYPRLGGMTRGSGFAIGPGYRTHAGPVFIDTSAALSTRYYKAVDVRARWIQAWNERAEVWTDYRFEDYPQEDFYGMGPDTLESMRTSYRFRGSDLTVRAHLTPMPWLRTGLNVGYLHPSVGPGSDREFPSIEQLFATDRAPGLSDQPDFVHTELFVDVDFRDTPGNPTQGGSYRAAFSTWNDRTLEAFDFRRFDGNVSQFLPLSADKKHVVSGRLGISLVNNATDNQVPFYFLPYVGGTDTIRSFREFRFKDENAMWLGAEYRWIPIKWVSAALFADFGKVARDWQDVTNLADLKHGYGVGIRVHSSKQTFARLDVGFGGGEGTRIFLKLGPSF